MSQLNIGIMGASGRMGRMLIEATLNNPNTALKGAFVRSISSLIGADSGEFIGVNKTGVPLSTITLDGVQALIDFSLPEALDEVLVAQAAAIALLQVFVLVLHHRVPLGEFRHVPQGARRAY